MNRKSFKDFGFIKKERKQKFKPGKTRDRQLQMAQRQALTSIVSDPHRIEFYLIFT
jgi:hypothetical protein